MLPLSALGQRIMILGPSNSGKSTLAVALSRKLAVCAVHLDQLRHIPNTNWHERSDAEFSCLHNQAIKGETWVMEGNYTALLPQRFDRATGVILLKSNVWFRYFRYVRRTLRNTQSRAGHLEGGQDRLSWKMTKWIIKTRNKGARYTDLVQAAGKPFVICHTNSALNDLYSAWKLDLP